MLKGNGLIEKIFSEQLMSEVSGEWSNNRNLG